MTTLAGLPCATPAIPPAVTFHECPFQAIEAAWLTCPTASARGSLHPVRRIPAKAKMSQLVNRVCIVFMPPTATNAGSLVGLEGGRPALSQEIVAGEPRSLNGARHAGAPQTSKSPWYTVMAHVLNRAHCAPGQA